MRARTGFWSLSQKTKLSHFFFYSLLLFLPSQLGKHFWPNFSYVYGIRVDYLSPTFYFTDLLIVLLFASFVFENIKIFNKVRIHKKTSFELFIFFLITLFLISGIILAKNPTAGFYGLVKLFEFVFLISYTAKNFRKLNKKVIYSSFFIGVFFESLLTIAQYFNQGSIGGIMYYFGERSFNSQTPGIANASIGGQLFLRPYGTFPHPNLLAAYLFVSMYLILIFSTRLAFKYKNFFTYLILFLGTLSLFLSLSRVAIIAWILSIIFFLILIFWKKTGIDIVKKYKFKISEGLIAVFFVFLVIVVGFYIPTFGRFSGISLSDESVIQREQLATDAIIIFRNSPLQGAGINNFLINLPPVEKNLHQSFYLQPVHNIFLLVLSETGVLGFILFLILLIKIFLNIKQDRELLILFLGIIFLGFFDHYFLTLQEGQILFAFLIGVFLSF